MVEQLEQYEETELWPMVVSTLLQRQNRPEPRKPPEAVVEEEFNALSMGALEAGVHAVDETVMQRAEKLVKVQCVKGMIVRSGFVSG